MDAARKAGTAPAEVDEQGNAINPHIPEYIVKAPWYADTGHASLKHQKNWAAQDESEIGKIGEWYDRGLKAGPAAKKYRKGACENCGAMTHSKKDCLERPRKRGAKYTNSNIVADEVIQKVKGGYDAKRDRYNGYDPASHAEVFKEYQAMEEERKKLREEEVDKQTSTELAAVAKKDKTKAEDDDAFGSSDEDERDEDKYADAADAVGQKLDTKNRVSVRNLRIREDTAKYLLNLDTESAYYDPKTRSMRDAPVQGNPEDLTFAGDNFLRYSGDAANIQKLQLFAWQSAARGNNVHMNANPTQGELLHKNFQDKKEELRDTSKVSVLAKYGGAEYLEKVPKELLTGQTENYVEYSRTGAIVKGQERAKAKSKYTEDVFLSNHTSVWGSWYDLASGDWGFACCHLTIPGAYCTGKAGIEANDSTNVQKMLENAANREDERQKKSLQAEASSASATTPTEASGKGKGRADAEPYSSKGRRVGEGDDIALDKERLKAALAAEKKRKGVVDEDEAWNQAKRSKTDVTEEDMEAYRLTRASAFDDPMANYKDEEDN